jgi:hypothetical protein
LWLKPDFDNMLPELKAIPHWVLAKEVIRDGKATKPPFQPNGTPRTIAIPKSGIASLRSNKRTRRLHRGRVPCCQSRSRWLTKIAAESDLDAPFN